MSEPARRSTLLVPSILLAAVVALVLAARIGGPSDLNQNTDQNKTAAFTLDIVTNGQWMLPRDTMGDRTLKPPLVNWVGVPFLATGWRAELAYKAPSLLAGAITLALCVWMARRLYARLSGGEDERIGAMASGLALAAGAAWLASPANVKHVYFLRPDMTFAMLITAGWIGATGALESERKRAQLGWAALMWLAAGLAAITKGPLALLVPLYAIVAARVIHGRFAALARTRFWWGLPVMLAFPALWLALAWQVDPDHVSANLLSGELGKRIDKGTTGLDLLRLLDSTWRIPALAVERFVPWAIFAFASLILVPPRRWASHPLAPAIVWFILFLMVIMVFANKAGSYLLPVYPAAAILAVYAIARFGRRIHIQPWPIAAGALVVAGAVCGREAFLSRGAKTRAGDHIKAFAADARAIVGADPVVFLNTGYNAAPLLMGRLPLGPPSEDEIAAARWIVMSVDDPATPPGARALVATPILRQPITLDGEPAERDVALGLFHAPGDVPTSPAPTP